MASPVDPARTARTPADDDDLDLPALDGEGEEPAEAVHDELEVHDDGGDPMDDATAEHDPPPAIEVEGAETGWLVDAEDAATADVGAFDLSLGGDATVLEEEETPATADDTDLDTSEDDVSADGGEEGPLADDEELREEDLPALDADEDGDVADDALYDRSLIGEDELRWDDRAWARAPAADADLDPADDSGMLAVPGEDPENGARDATWRRFEESGRLSAATLLPGGNVVIALRNEDRAVLVKIVADGTARIIAEIEGRRLDEDESELAEVTSLRWDAAHGMIVASGAFGVQAFKPA